jgi:hypothetical protein
VPGPGSMSPCLRLARISPDHLARRFPHRAQTVTDPNPTPSGVVSQRCPRRTTQASWRNRLMTGSCASAGRTATNVVGVHGYAGEHHPASLSPCPIHAPNARERPHGAMRHRPAEQPASRVCKRGCASVVAGRRFGRRALRRQRSHVRIMPGASSESPASRCISCCDVWGGALDGAAA